MKLKLISRLLVLGLFPFGLILWLEIYLFLYNFLHIFSKKKGFMTSEDGWNLCKLQAKVPSGVARAISLTKELMILPVGN